MHSPVAGKLGRLWQHTRRKGGSYLPTNPIAGIGICTTMGEGNKEQLTVILLIVAADKNGWRRVSSQGEC